MEDRTVEREEATKREDAARKGLSRKAVIAIVAVVLLIVGGGTVFGVNAYRDAQATRAAEELVASVVAERELTDGELASFSGHLTEAKGTLEQLVTINEMVQAREDVFEGETRTALGESVASLETEIGEATEPRVNLPERLSGSDWGEALIEEYRAGNAEVREAIESEVQQALDTLQKAQAEAQQAGLGLVDEVQGARLAAVQVAEALPAKVEALVETHNEAGAEAQDALRETLNAESFTEVSADALQEVIDALPDHLIVYIETADQLKASHTNAVEEREAAEAAAAAAAAAAQPAPSGGGGSGGGGGSSLCYTWTWLGTVLEPC